MLFLDEDAEKILDDQTACEADRLGRHFLDPSDSVQHDISLICVVREIVGDEATQPGVVGRKAHENGTRQRRYDGATVILARIRCGFGLEQKKPASR